MTTDATPDRDILVLYYSREGHTEAMARQVVMGVESVPGARARLRTVPPVHDGRTAVEASLAEHGPAWVEANDLRECSGLVLGSPTRFGNMAAALKYFFDGTGAEWFSGTLSGKPAGLFTSSSSPHGGQESTPLSMMLPLLHHGMLIVGLPYSEPGLTRTQGGGSPYGAGHVSGKDGDRAMDDDEKSLCRALGKRVAETALRLDVT
jgi:NAD(P)H dehydrogenase (quinone)